MDYRFKADDVERKILRVAPTLDNLRARAVAEGNERLENLLRFAPVSVSAMVTREEVVDLMTQHRLSSLPVVDAENRGSGSRLRKSTSLFSTASPWR